MPTQRLVLPGPNTALDTREALEQLFLEVERLNARQSQLEFELKKVLYAEPAKPRDGMFARADGTTWNPGGTGAGLYQYQGAAWVKL